MAPIPSNRRSSVKSRSRNKRKTQAHHEATADIPMAEPPRKKRRYVPGGPGGGGRYVDADGTEVPVGGTGPGGYNYVGPRGRVGRENAANGIQPATYIRPRRESRREKLSTRPRYSSAAAAAAAVAHGDGFKPREERSWEEFHQDLEMENSFPIFSADDVDGIVHSPPTPGITGTSRNGIVLHCQDVGNDNATISLAPFMSTPSDVHGIEDSTKSVPAWKRKPGRPFRRHDSMLKGIGLLESPKIIPLPGPNPREKLTLPKPSFRSAEPFTTYEHKAAGQMNYVDRTMANVGYQESDIYIRSEKRLIRVMEGTPEEELDTGPSSKVDSDFNEAISGVSVGRVEYDMDEQDQRWLEEYNIRRKAEQVEPIKPAIFEITMTKIEKEWHALEKRIPKPNPKPPQTHRPRSSSAAAVKGEPTGAGEEQDSKCAICDDGDCENTNAIVFCDGCDLAVHQECYGVPFIPEGQWLCRKCQLIGGGTPTCIFCPNTDGAFKQTNASRWSHLLCAIWIPEVSLGNTTFMEPVMDVEKVPRQRWKLTCYICRQKMGACIQCGNKNCFVAFHVTCARRARLFLQMKSTHGGPAHFDASMLKAYCDKHVPNDWRRENDVDNATADAMDYYHYSMRGRLWADSQQAATSLADPQTMITPAPSEEKSQPKINLIVGGNKRKRTQVSKAVWKLPSGAPVVPAALYESVESSLQRFTVRKRRDYAMEICRYWTLKREARRGAALLKRLQLQMETFSSTEITRRNFVGMGAAGRVRLERRVDFAEKLSQDVDKLRILCDEIKRREREKLRDVEILRDIIDTVYLPIPPLLWPIIEKCQALDGKGTFRVGFSKIRERLVHRFYTSVSVFSADLGSVFSTAIGMNTAADTAEVQSRMTAAVPHEELTSDMKDKRRLAKRIIKAVQGLLEDAMRKESELCRKPFEKELRDLDLLLENSISSRRDILAGTRSHVDDLSDDEVEQLSPAMNGDTAASAAEEESNKSSGHSTMSGINISHISSAHKFSKANSAEQDSGKMTMAHHHPTPEESNATPEATRHSHVKPFGHDTDGRPILHEANSLPIRIEPPTPPRSSGGDLQTSLSTGGVPWYMEPFDPVGTSIEEERWTGREQMRSASEELSDMDEEELLGLVDVDDMENSMQTLDSDGTLRPESVGYINGSNAIVQRKAAAKKRKWRGFR